MGEDNIKTLDETTDTVEDTDSCDTSTPSFFFFNVWGYREQREYTSFFTQREAAHKKTQPNVLNTTQIASFFFDVPCPTVNIAMIDGYKSLDELGGTGEDEPD